MAKTATDLQQQYGPEINNGFFLKRELLEGVERRAHLTEMDIAVEFPEYPDWKYGRARITNQQLQELAELTLEPYSFFLLEYMSDDDVIKDYRNSQGVGVVRKEIELTPSLRHRLEVSYLQQDYLHEYRSHKGVSPWRWLESIRWIETSPEEGAKALEELVGVDRSGYLSASEFLGAVVSGMERKGVLVQSSNVVDQRSWRPLDLSVFNCFQLLDEFAPLIFVHSDTSDEAQLYVLLYGLLHLLVGEVGIGLINVEDVFDLKGVELWCSQVVLEYLIPEKGIRDCYNSNDPMYIQIVEISSEFRVNPFITMVRLRQLDLIDIELYQNCFKYYNYHYRNYLHKNSRFFNQDSHIRSVGEPLWQAATEDYFGNQISNKEASSVLDQPHSVLTKLYREYHKCD